jgi:hypothetical protein
MQENKFADKLKSNRSYKTHASISSKGAGGRPKKSDEVKLSERVFVNLSKTEKEELEAYAIERGFNSISAVIRMMIINETSKDVNGS